MNLYPPDREPDTFVPPASPSGMHAGTPYSAQRPKRKLSIGFFILGFVTPWAVGAMTGATIGLFGDLGPVGSFFAVTLPGATFLAQLVSWLVGRTNGNDRLRSWGLGGVASLTLQLLGVLLLFGACAIGLGS